MLVVGPVLVVAGSVVLAIAAVVVDPAGAATIPDASIGAVAPGWGASALHRPAVASPMVMIGSTALRRITRGSACSEITCSVAAPMSHNIRAPGGTAVERAARYAAYGLARRRWPRGTTDELATAVRTDPDARARAAALGALVRRAHPKRADTAWADALDDPDAAVRRRAAELAPLVATAAPGCVALLDDPDALVAEAAAWALGELPPTPGSVAALAAAASDHTDPLVREAAVAALGANGDPAGLPAILAACRDKPAIRRRAVLALAPFEGPAVEAAIARALDDRDWQVRQAAEDLSDPSRSAP